MRERLQVGARDLPGPSAGAEPSRALLSTQIVPSTTVSCPRFPSISASGVSELRDSRLLLPMLPTEQANDRREASLHFKMALALQFMDEPEDGLAHCQQALGMMESKLDELKSLGEPLSVPRCCCLVGRRLLLVGTVVLSAAAAAAAVIFFLPVPEGEGDSEAAEGVTEDIKGVLEDLRDKEVELKEVIAQNNSTKEAIKVCLAPPFGYPAVLSLLGGLLRESLIDRICSGSLCRRTPLRSSPAASEASAGPTRPRRPCRTSAWSAATAEGTGSRL